MGSDASVDGSRQPESPKQRPCRLTRPLTEQYTRAVSRNQRVTRLVYGTFVVLVTAFVVSNIWQVARAVFFTPESEAEMARAPKVGEECSRALKQSIRAIENARLAASMEPNGDAAKARYTRERRQPSLGLIGDAPQEPAGDPKGACSSDSHGTAALAALVQLDRTAETHAVRDARELSPVRLATHSFIRGQPR